MTSLNLVPNNGIVEGGEGDSESEEEENKSGLAPEKNEADGSKRPQALQDLYNIISKLEAPGTFACGGTLPSIYPGLHFNGYGDVSLPLRDQDAQQIISLCQRAPFGRGEQTIVDTTVRNTWQLNPSEVQITNKEFVQEINTLVSNTIAVELGLGTSSAIGAQLYKVLLYEPGGLFVPHRDTEKQAGIFGSLVVTLPSTFSGGALVVHHQDTSRTFTVNNPSFTMSYVAFFADCKHEIQPVPSGHRLVLVYDLISMDNGPIPSPSSNDSVREAIACIKRWTRSSDSRFVCVLQHPYMSSGVSIQALKDKDRAVVQLLQEAIKEESDLELTLALLKFLQFDSKSTYECSDTIIASLINADGEKFGIDLRIEHSDLYPSDAFDHCAPDDASGSSDSDGVSPLYYRRVVVIVWPKVNWFDWMCGCKQADAVAHLTRQITKCSVIEARDSPDWLQCQRIAEAIIEKHPEMEIDGEFLIALTKIGDFELIQKYFRILKKRYTYRPEGEINQHQFYPGLETCITKFGWDLLYPLIEHVLYTLNFDRSVFLNHFAKSFEKRDLQTHAWMQFYLRRYADEKLNGQRTYNELRESEVLDLVHLSCTMDTYLLTPIFMKVRMTFRNVDLQLIPLLKKIRVNTPSVAQEEPYIKLVLLCMSVLQKRVFALSIVPETWSFPGFKPCVPNCPECAKISSFMFSPTEMEFQLAKAQTKIHDHLKQHLLLLYPGMFAFEREGRYPYTFVAIKINRESDMARKKAAEDTATIKQLEDLLEDPGLPANKRQKITHDAS